jgi:NAD(P)H dehydrogenase (quinone)
MTTRTDDTIHPAVNTTIHACVVYYSSTGNIHAVAQASVEGAIKAGAEVRLRRVAETAPRQAVDSNERWAAHAEATRDVTEATVADLDWADVVIFGVPTRFGLPASQLGAFIDTTGPLWQQGRLADKVYAAFTASGTGGGQESTLLALNRVFTHWGGIIVPPGYTDPIQFRTGNPYGVHHLAGSGMPDDITVQAARHQATRAVEVAAALKAGRATGHIDEGAQA